MSRTVEMIEWEQKLTITMAYSYNTEDNPMTEDMIYDYGIARLHSIKNMYPESWELSTMYPEIFLDSEEAWRYTSSHFPKNEEIAGWLEERKQIIADGKARIAKNTK